MVDAGKGYKLTDYFQKMEKADPETITFDQFYEMFPKEFTKTPDDFRQRLIQHSKFLETTGLESTLCSSSDPGL